MKKILLSILIVTISTGLFSTCDITQPEPIVKPGRLKIFLKFSSEGVYNIREDDALYVQARDFKIFSNENFADVFQSPDQFLAYSDSIVSFNLLNAAKNDSLIQVAYGSVPPLEYDSLLFQIVPAANMRLDGESFPISTNYSDLPVENDYSSIISLRSKFKIQENKTTSLIIEFKVEKTVFRVLDTFIFTATPDKFTFKNE